MLRELAVTVARLYMAAAEQVAGASGPEHRLGLAAKVHMVNAAVLTVLPQVAGEPALRRAALEWAEGLSEAAQAGHLCLNLHLRVDCLDLRHLFGAQSELVHDLEQMRRRAHPIQLGGQRETPWCAADGHSTVRGRRSDHQ